ncbi:neocarzinostatin apoprotein domain-containing protein [Conexibacter sp. JD483]|uniref:neocarzinostatin apoprotein domain-containing protein n=1 Tax=unclassified Conexibacter TaxID=2627773 RepID=UPI002725A4FD|nr:MULTISPECIES: neocarzinostatin apoprotein domain-containing protein [unclassified Conexibacter]MDO8186858.1 neocarzinostatin apoprotein domain-containing protein [Conexibacter sp. CPCC 205706]MDO8200830.1 neocarzinostatin apoprotein domain-containing protein [Conexibacter sp. CPCC 205762]MDR9369966.1 neocarzinostatin apoprotein domain-containing protein [Conexibacter sp. JD483]
MLNAAFKGLGRPVASVAVAAAMLFAGASAASAASITVTPNSGLAASDTVVVGGSGFAASTTYRAGQCSNRAYGVIGVPACGPFTDVSTDPSGSFTGLRLAVTKRVTNVHAGLGAPIGTGQPATFNCLGSSGDQCAIWIVAHTGTPSVLASANILFS